MSETQVERFISEGELVCALLVMKKGEGETPFHPLAQPLVHKFEDVFPNDLCPSLPLIRGIEHQIDLLPRVSLQNK